MAEKPIRRERGRPASSGLKIVLASIVPAGAILYFLLLFGLNALLVLGTLLATLLSVGWLVRPDLLGGWGALEGLWGRVTGWFGRRARLRW